MMKDMRRVLNVDKCGCVAGWEGFENDIQDLGLVDPATPLHGLSRGAAYTHLRDISQEVISDESEISVTMDPSLVAFLETEDFGDE